MANPNKVLSAGIAELLMTRSETNATPISVISGTDIRISSLTDPTRYVFKINPGWVHVGSKALNHRKAVAELRFIAGRTQTILLRTSVPCFLKNPEHPEIPAHRFNDINNVFAVSAQMASQEDWWLVCAIPEIQFRFEIALF